MTTVRIRRHLLKWGNSYGLRLTRDEVNRLHASDKTPVTAEISTDDVRIDVDRFAVFQLGARASEEHDQDFEAAVDAGH